MEYIQCPHCRKKYSVNDKVRAASGRTIRCKGCNEPFEITIFSSPTAAAATEQESAAAEAPPNRAGQQEGDSQQPSSPKPGRKISGKHLQLILTIVLAIVLIAGLVTVIMLPDRKQESPRIAAPVVQIPAPRVKKADMAPPQEQKGEQERGQIEESEAARAAAPEPAPAPIEKVARSEACRQAATDQWFADYMITHTAISGREYVRLLDQSSFYTEKVRTSCNDLHLAATITEAAGKGEKPEWIRAEIEARTQGVNEPESEEKNSP